MKWVELFTLDISLFKNTVINRRINNEMFLVLIIKVVFASQGFLLANWTNIYKTSVIYFLSMISFI